MRIWLMACAIMMLLPAGVQAAPSEARTALEETVGAVLGELKKPGLHDPGQRGAILADVERIILRLFDFNELSSRTVGASWKSFNPDQKNRFTDAFTMLLRETYLEKLYGYKGEQVSYAGETASATGDKVEIQTSVAIDGKPVSIAYRMLKKQRWMVYDVIVEGVSLVQNYRNQFQEMLGKGDAETLIKAVAAKAEKMREFNRDALAKP
jgi:phospholipid transport system substrate-binding protein